MGNPIERLHITLNSHKGFEVAHTSDNHNEMLIEIDNRVYKVSLEDTGEEKLSFEIVDRYLR